VNLRFKPGDAIDTEHCTALKHEFLCCEDAFKEFQTYATGMIMKAQAEAEGQPEGSAQENRFIAYEMYNAYAKFIHHLYEFILGAVQREHGSTSKLEGEIATRYIQGHAQRVLSGRRQAILNGTAPAWENSLSYFPEKVPSEFATKFRQLRNKISAHVTHERATIDLSDFYDRYHKYVHMLYWNCLGHWGLRDKDFPDLKEITKFSVLLKGSGLP
jgi:hypothetical protein